MVSWPVIMRYCGVVRDLRMAAESISGLVSRRERALSAVSTVLGLSSDQLDPSSDWNSFAVSSYLDSRPFCLYFEPAFTDYHRHLENTYSNDLTLFASDFTASGHDLWKAIDTAERIATEVENEKLSRLDPHTAVTQYLNPWYLRLVEQAFDSLLGFAVYRLQTNIGKQPPRHPWNIYEATKKYRWYGSGNFYRPTVRNGIAHDFEFIQDTVFSQVSVIYTDARGNTETLAVSELIDEVTGMVDECIAYAFALRLFILQHTQDSSIELVLSATPSNRRLREHGFKNFASSHSIIVESVRADIINGKRQTRIECLDLSRIEPERLAEMVAILISANAWFPDCDTILVGLKSKDPISFARIDADVLASWVREEMDDEIFLRSFDPIMMWPKRVRLGRLRANLARTIPAALNAGRDEFKSAKNQLPGQLPAAIRVLSVSDISHGLARRYRGDFLADVNDQATIRELLHQLLVWIKRQRIHHSPESKQRWGKIPPVYVAGFLYSREKRERDRGALPTSDYYIGQFEWRDPDTDPDVLPIPIRDGEDLELGLAYKPALSWPPIDRFIPR